MSAARTATWGAVRRAVPVAACGAAAMAAPVAATPVAGPTDPATTARLGVLPDGCGGWSTPDRGAAPHDRGLVRRPAVHDTRPHGVGASHARRLKPARVAAEASLEARHEERR